VLPCCIRPLLLLLLPACDRHTKAPIALRVCAGLTPTTPPHQKHKHTQTHTNTNVHAALLLDKAALHRDLGQAAAFKASLLPQVGTLLDEAENNAAIIKAAKKVGRVDGRSGLQWEQSMCLGRPVVPQPRPATALLETARTHTHTHMPLLPCRRRRQAPCRVT
jgi:hypothetical protein